MTKYFVTGGAGFIGSHLADRLMEEGNQVTVYDNLVSGRREWIEHHLGKKNFRFIEADLLNFDTLKQTIKGHEVIWHLGANTDIPTGNKITDLDLKNCTIATRNVLEAMRENNIDKIIFASSACVYGDAPPVALNEAFGPLLPINLYGAGKLACEGLISAYSHLFGIKAWLFRFANVVGGIAPELLRRGELIKQVAEDLEFSDATSFVILEDDAERKHAQEENRLLLQGIPQIVGPHEPDSQ